MIGIEIRRIGWVIPRFPGAPVVLLGLVVLGIGPGQAQSVPDRGALEQLRQRLSEATTIQEARALGQAVNAGLGGPVLALRRGFVAIRLGELTGDRKYFDDAIQQFDDVTLRARDWPYPWFGLAVAKVSLHRQDALAKSSLHQPDGVSYFEGFTRAITEVFARDSTFAPAIDLLRHTMAGQGERRQPRALLAPIRRVAGGADGAAEDALILARVFRRRDMGDSALVMLDLYRLRGGDFGVAQLEQAHTLASFGSPAAASEAYLNGLSRVSPESRAAYRVDLAWIADPVELGGFDRAPDDSLGEWVVEFWRWRDLKELRQPGERLREHLRRWAFVDGHYRVVNPERRTQFAHAWATQAGPCNRGDYFLADDILGDSVVHPADGRRRERLYDDRAYVYMRHGEPARRISGKALEAPGDAAPPPPGGGGGEDASGDEHGSLAAMLLGERLDDARANESWLYWFGGDRRVFHFEGSKMLGLGAPTTLAVEPLPDVQWLELRGQLDPSYLRLAHILENPHPAIPAFSCERLVQQAVARMRTDASVALRTDSYTLLFRREILPVVQVYALGRPDLGTGRILVVYALPGEQLVAEAGEPGRPSGVLYPVETRVSATDSAQRIGRSVDTTRQFLSTDTLRAGSHLSGYVELAVPPGLYRVGTALFQPGADVGGAVLRDSLDLRLPGGGLYLSDLVLGRDGSGLGWTYRGGRVPLNPLGAFPRGEAAEVFYELSGLTPGRSYITSMEVAPVKGGSERESVRLRFTAIAEQDEIRVRRSLGLSRLKRGQYQVTVEVIEEGSSRKVRRQQYLTIID